MSKQETILPAGDMFQQLLAMSGLTLPDRAACAEIINVDSHPLGIDYYDIRIAAPNGYETYLMDIESDMDCATFLDLLAAELDGFDSRHAYHERLNTCTDTAKAGDWLDAFEDEVYFHTRAKDIRAMRGTALRLCALYRQDNVDAADLRDATAAAPQWGMLSILLDEMAKDSREGADR